MKGFIEEAQSNWPDTGGTVPSASAEIRRLQEENQRLRNAVTLRSGRMQVLWEWMTEQYETDRLSLIPAEYFSWFDADGVPK